MKFNCFFKHYIDNIWRCYNDNVVTICQGDYSQKGIPYILLYKKLENQLNNSNMNNKTQIPQNGGINNFQQGLNMGNNFQGNLNININVGNMNFNNFKNNMNMFNIGNMNNNNNF